MWLTISFIAYALMAVVSILDKFIISNEKVKPSVFVYYSTIYLLPLNLGFIFIGFPSYFIFRIGAFSAATFALGLWAMYRAMQKIEISHVGPFIGGLIPLVVLLLSRIFLSENISSTQLAGIILLSFGTFLISLQKEISSEWKSGISWAVLSVLFFSFSHVSSKFIYDQDGFVPGFLLIWGLMGFVGLGLLFMPTVRAKVFPKQNIFSKFFSKFSIKRKSNHELGLIVADKGISAVGMLLIQYAVAIGSVTKVYALAGFQYGLLIIVVALMSKFAPKFFKESYDKGEMKKELLSVLIIILGLALLV